jgi:8-oxo-dGTP pyrophosphatase MutT (NUDIX family)
MSKAYLALHDEKNRFFLVKKRLRNMWWEGHLAAKPTVVNQAGQWALPGGRRGKESPEAAALREFLEETGVDLDNFATKTPVVVKTVPGERAADYYLVDLPVKGERLLSICEHVNINLQPSDLEPRRPRGPILDWELDEAVLVSAEHLSGYLGAKQSVPLRLKEDLAAVSLDSQKIDWYRDMALLLQQMYVEPA